VCPLERTVYSGVAEKSVDEREGIRIQTLKYADYFLANWNSFHNKVELDFELNLSQALLCNFINFVWKFQQYW